MSVPIIQNTTTTPMSVSKPEKDAVTTAVKHSSAGALEGVQYVKDALTANPGGLSDAELNVLANTITQLTAAFSVIQAFLANVTSFEQLEKGLEQLHELLEDLEKAKRELKEGLKTIMIAESLSFAFAGAITAKGMHTTLRSLKQGNFVNGIDRNLNSKPLGLEVGIAKNGAPAAASNQKTASAEGQTTSGSRPTAGNRTSEAKQSSLKQRIEKALEKEESDLSWNPYKSSTSDGKFLSQLNSKDVSSLDSGTLQALRSRSLNKRQVLDQVFQLELVSARMVQEFVSAFSHLGSTQQNLAQTEWAADSNVYSSMTEYWSTLMGTFQRLNQEYQSAFQSDLGALEQDVSQANTMAQYVYRS